MLSEFPTPRLIFIVEDYALYAELLQVFFKHRFPSTQVETFPQGEPMLEHLHKRPDFIIMDYHLDGNNHTAANGLTMIGQIRVRYPEAKIFILSAQQDIAVARAVKEAGCLYLVKNNDAFENLQELIIRDLR